MSKYTVVWSKAVLDSIADAWVNMPAHRRAITSACDEIDRLLKQAPLRYSRALAEGMYAIEVAPVRIIFSFSETDRIVKVSLLRLAV